MCVQHPRLSGAAWPTLPKVKGRYHVYTFCPGACISIALSLRGLLAAQSRARGSPTTPSVPHAADGADATDPDLCGAPTSRPYDQCTPGGSYSGRCSPLLVDLTTSTIISNESADIIRMINDFDIEAATTRVARGTARSTCIRSASPPTSMRSTRTYRLINNGVTGLARDGVAYEAAERDVHNGRKRRMSSSRAGASMRRQGLEADAACRRRAL